MIKQNVTSAEGEVLIFGPASTECIAGLAMDAGLKVFRPPEPQKLALQMIAEPVVGRIYLATWGNVIIGYITFHQPESDSRFMQNDLKYVIELGAIEVSVKWRKHGVGKRLLDVAFQDDYFEDHIVTSNHYAWHYDLRGTGLTMLEYKKMLTKLMQSGGMEKRGTDDPEIISHPGNFMVAKVGKRVTAAQVVAFERCLYKQIWML